MNYAARLLRNGNWIHFFPEGRVIPRAEFSDPALLTTHVDLMNTKTDNKSAGLQSSYSLKWGIARLIIEHVLFEGETKDSEYFDNHYKNKNKVNSYEERMTENYETFSASETLPEIDVLPIYHIGMDEVLPTRQPYILQMFRRVTFLVRPEGPIRIDRRFLMNLFKDNLDTNHCDQDDHKSELSLTEKRICLMKFLERELNILGEKARALHFNRLVDDD